jgi:hypothetical protein
MLCSTGSTISKSSFCGDTGETWRYVRFHCVPEIDTTSCGCDVKCWCPHRPPFCPAMYSTCLPVLHTPATTASQFLPICKHNPCIRITQFYRPGSCRSNALHLYGIISRLHYYRYLSNLFPFINRYLPQHATL